MAQVIQARKVTIGVLKQEFGLALVRDPEFFPECQEINPELTDLERQWLDRIRDNFLGLLDNPPLLENSVKMVVLSPLLDLAGFYRDPFRIESEASIEVEMEAEGDVIRGRIDVLVVKERLWLLVIEAKRSEFAVNGAIAQALAGMLGNPDSQQPTFGLVTNGNEFIFLKLTRDPNQYANSRLFSLNNPRNELYGVLGVLKQIGAAIVP
jgi:hypothetical protein